MQKNLREILTFEEALDNEVERLEGELEKILENPNYLSVHYQHYSYLKRGIYVDQLKVWHNLFPKEQILVLNFEDFFGNLPSSMIKVTDFLGVSMYNFQCEPLSTKELMIK